ncbi:MAG: hypothetical protein JJ900_11245 [Rhodospirillales bacterium]|nr:hypothetical protein [Rhodospirillales bacterium]MBO6787416.1 hypothetical protein [Rhodospirillales bacterium]
MELRIPKMTCPCCGHEFARYSSLRLSPFTVIQCRNCGAALKRTNKLMPLLLALGGVFAFGLAQTQFSLTTGGKMVVLGLVIWVALLVDEATAKLAPVDPK